MNQITICGSDRKYIDQITAIENDSFSDPWADSGFTDEAEIPGSYCFVATDENNDVSGYIIFRILLDEVHFLKIAVKKNARKQGTGQKLIDKMLETARQKNAYVIYLEVNTANRPAIELYKKNGFRETGRRNGYYGNEDALNMELITGHPSLSYS